MMHQWEGLSVLQPKLPPCSLGHEGVAEHQAHRRLGGIGRKPRLAHAVYDAPPALGRSLRVEVLTDPIGLGPHEAADAAVGHDALVLGHMGL